MTTTLTLLLSLLQPLVASTEAPNLCADVHLESTGEPITDSTAATLPRFCAWTGPSAPVWDGDVCCNIDGDIARCSTTTSAGRCASGMKMYCKYGEILEDDTVTCYQPFPSAANPDAVQSTEYIQEELLCCQNGDCYEWTDQWAGDCEGTFSWCWWGYLNEEDSMRGQVTVRALDNEVHDVAWWWGPPRRSSRVCRGVVMGACDKLASMGRGGGGHPKGTSKLLLGWS